MSNDFGYFYPTYQAKFQHSRGHREWRSNHFYAGDLAVQEEGSVIWKDEKYRKIMFCGDVYFGAIYPPRRSPGSWRWRIWITRSGHPQEGRDRDERSARAQVETRFWDFLHTAGLEPKDGAQ